jgi:hypothetical protein
MSEESGSNASNNPLAGQSGENLVSLGALLVIGSWLIFEVIAEDYFVTTVAVGLGLLILILPRFDIDAITDIAPVPAFLKLAGYALALIGVVEIIDEIQGGILDAGGSAILGALIAYAGYVLAFLGARQA